MITGDTSSPDWTMTVIAYQVCVFLAELIRKDRLLPIHPAADGLRVGVDEQLCGVEALPEAGLEAAERRLEPSARGKLG